MVAGVGLGEEGFEDLFGREADLAGDRDGGEVFGVDFVGAELVGDAEGVEEAGGVGLGWGACLHPAASTFGDDLAVAHGEDVVGEGLGEVGLVGGEEDGAAAAAVGDGPGAEVGEELDHVLCGGGVEVGERLVEEEEFGVGLEDAGEGGALAHALGVLADGAVEVGVEADGAEGHLGAADAGAASVAVEARRSS